MSRNVVKRVEHPDGKCRLEIMQNRDGTFSFDEFVFDEVDKAFCLVRPQYRSVGRMASQEECLAEAKGRIPWLAEATDDASTS